LKSRNRVQKFLRNLVAVKFTANETGGNFSETAYGSTSLTTGSAFFAQYEFNLLYLQRGNKHYELTNHTSTALSTSLGNVLAVITDKRLLSCMGDTIQASSANIVSATDYSPFGAPLAGRVFSANEYRFGFNSKEKDNETYGDGNTYDYGARIYDARKGRFLTIDPMFEGFAYYSPYQSTGNCPAKYIDSEGRYILDPNLQKTQPLLYNYIVNGGLNTLANNPAVKKYLMSLGHIDEAQLKSILISTGEKKLIGGPNIRVAKPPGLQGAYAGGEYVPENDAIYINPKLIEQLNSSKPEERAAAEFAIGMVILHETVHYGRDMKANPKRNMSIFHHDELTKILNVVGSRREIKINKDITKVLFEDSPENIAISDKIGEKEPGTLFEILATGTYGSKGKDQEQKCEPKIYLENAKKSIEKLKLQ